MLRGLKHLHGHKLGASDGEIGHIRDFYFDDQDWVVRYLVADTGSWLPGRQVLLSPHAIGPWDEEGKVLRMNLTRQQIEKSPPIELHKPVSRQFEDEYYQYYGWPVYWMGDGMWGMSGFPAMGAPALPLAVQPPARRTRRKSGADAHLRSSQSVTGYEVQASNGPAGHIADFVVDDKSWEIARVVIKTGHLFSGKEVEIPVTRVTRVSYEKSTISVKLTVAAVEKSREHAALAV